MFVYVSACICVHVFACMYVCVSESKSTITCMPDCSSLVRSLQRQILIYWVSEKRRWVCHWCCLNVLHYRAQCYCSFLEILASTAMAAQAAPTNPNCVIIYKTPRWLVLGWSTAEEEFLGTYCFHAYPSWQGCFTKRGLRMKHLRKNNSKWQSKYFIHIIIISWVLREHVTLFSRCSDGYKHFILWVLFRIWVSLMPISDKLNGKGENIKFRTKINHMFDILKWN